MMTEELSRPRNGIVSGPACRKRLSGDLPVPSDAVRILASGVQDPGVVAVTTGNARRQSRACNRAASTVERRAPENRPTTHGAQRCPMGGEARSTAPLPALRRDPLRCQLTGKRLRDDLPVSHDKRVRCQLVHVVGGLRRPHDVREDRIPSMSPLPKLCR